MKARDLFWGLIAGLFLASQMWPLASAGVTSTGTTYALVPGVVSRNSVDDATGTVELVAATSGKKIRVWGIMATTASSTTWTFKSGTNALTGPMTMSGLFVETPQGGQGITNATPIFETNAGEALNLVLGGAVQISGQVIYTVQ